VAKSSCRGAESIFDVSDLDRNLDDYAAVFVERLLTEAQAVQASDIHIVKSSNALDVSWRVHGRLARLGEFLDGEATSVLARLKALARLTTYRKDIPQEGRFVVANGSLEARIGTLPTLHGERAVIRLAAKQLAEWLPGDLGFKPSLLDRISDFQNLSSGVMVVSGPAGSGKTTTAYACLRALRSKASDAHYRSLVTLEDPVESELDGVWQSQVDPAKGFSWEAGLRALLRQDPDVLMVGEIRDSESAKVAFQAALTGQLVVTTMHARSCADAIRRLLDFEVPANHLRSGLELLTCQALKPKLCDCRQATNESKAELSGELDQGEKVCSKCQGTRIQSRIPLVEVLPTIEGQLSDAIVDDADTATLHKAAVDLGMKSLSDLIRAAESEGTIALVEG